jgi:hypothetical protein
LSSLTNRQQDHRERSPSIIPDSEPDLPSPVKFVLRAQAGETPAVERRRSVESFWVEDSEDERVGEGSTPQNEHR